MKILTCLLMICFNTTISTNLLASGGGSMSGGSSGYSTPEVRKTPREIAIASYNKGLKNRTRAWDYRAKADTATNEKKRAKYLKKADKQFAKAVKRFEKAIKNEPRLYQAHGSLGYALKQLHQYDEALAAYDLALQLKPDYSEAIEYRAEAHLALGRLEETKSAYIQLINIDRPRADLLMQVIQQWLQTKSVFFDKR